MIHWLLRSSQDLPTLKEDQPPVGLLASREQEQFAALKTEKRRHDWLLGRYTSKLLVRSIIQGEMGESLELDHIIIANDSDGAPYVSFNTGGKLPQPVLSISHSGDAAFCAAVGVPPSANVPFSLLGADIERVESRSPMFVQEYFTDKEAALVDRSTIQSRDMLVTAIWSAKEAALKALHLGLTVDTRSVICEVEPMMVSVDAWVSFSIEYDAPRLSQQLLDRKVIPPLLGWWRYCDGYVLTLASAASLQPNPSPA